MRRVNDPVIGPGRKLVPVLFAVDCLPCPACGESYCETHQRHYIKCPCVKPSEKGLTYVDTVMGLKAIVDTDRARRIGSG